MGVYKRLCLVLQREMVSLSGGERIDVFWPCMAEVVSLKLANVTGEVRLHVGERGDFIYQRICPRAWYRPMRSAWRARGGVVEDGHMPLCWRVEPIVEYVEVIDGFVERG